MKKILLIGGNGYIGSYFYFVNKNKYHIDIIDINWFSKNNNSKDFNNLDINYINKYDVLILLAGHSSVKMCDTDLVSSFNNNVRNFINLISKLNNKQKFIYASSSSVYGNTGNILVDEEHQLFEPNNYYDMSKKIIDMYITKTDINYYGLRFGTVNGWSPNLRADIMINSMVNSALNDAHIKLYIKDIMRPILGINDLVNAISTIVDNETSEKGLYNLASFNATAEEIADKVGEILSIPVIEYDVNMQKINNVKLQTNAYNFAIDSSKFRTNFNFEFIENIETITNSLINGFNNCVKSNRNELKKYE